MNSSLAALVVVIVSISNLRAYRIAKTNAERAAGRKVSDAEVRLVSYHTWAGQAVEGDLARVQESLVSSYQHVAGKATAGWFIKSSAGVIAGAVVLVVVAGFLSGSTAAAVGGVLTIGGCAVGVVVLMKQAAGRKALMERTARLA